jgi:DNA-binding GntR family transcriptional regulator
MANVPPTGDEASAAADAYRAMDEHFTRDRLVMRSREIAYEAIKGAILRGILEPRERLIEERLGEALQVSRTPVREALAILEHEGLIESIPYKGLMVRRITVDEFVQMYETLEAVEPALAQAAVHHVTQSDLHALATILDEAERCIPGDVPGYLAACREFQQRLGECAGNPYLTKIVVGIEERSDIYLIHTQPSLPPEKMRAAVRDRRAILEAMRSGDANAAAEAARSHAEAIRLRWRDLYVPD